VQYKAKAEAAIARGFANNSLVSNDLCDEILEAASQVNAEAVYDEEQLTKHDIRALVNVIKSKVSEDAKPQLQFLVFANGRIVELSVEKVDKSVDLDWYRRGNEVVHWFSHR